MVFYLKYPKEIETSFTWGCSTAGRRMSDNLTPVMQLENNISKTVFYEEMLFLSLTLSIFQIQKLYIYQKMKHRSLIKQEVCLMYNGPFCSYVHQFDEKYL
jgi:hypothetical protein